MPAARFPSLLRPSLVLGVIAVANALAIGGVHLTTRIATAAAALLAFLWLGLQRDRPAIRLGPIGVGLGILVGWTWLSVVPWPDGLVSLIAPAAAQARQEAAVALGVAAPSWVPLSLDAGRTAAAALSLTSAWLVFLTAANLKPQGTDRTAPLVTVVVAAGLVALVGVAQMLLGVERIWGFYEASVPVGDQAFLTTFVNPNHAGALFAFGAMCAYGLAVSRVAHRLGDRRYLGVAVLLAGAVVATLSRANTLLLLVDLLVVTLVANRRHRADDKATSPGLVLFALLAAGVAAVYLAGPGTWWRQMEWLSDPDTAGHYTDLWSVGLTVARDHLWTGTGHGALGSASPLVMNDWSAGLVDHAHNLEIQALSDWGLPACLLAGPLLCVGFARALWVGRRDMRLVAVGAGLCLLILQNQADFSLAIPGVGIGAALGLGWLTREAWAKSGAAAPATPAAAQRQGPQVVFSIAGAVGLAVCGLGFLAVREQPAMLEAKLRFASEPGGLAVGAGEALLEHPTDYHLFRVAAAAAHRSGLPAEATRLMERAVDLAPRDPVTLETRAQLRLAMGREVEAADDLVRLAGFGERWAAEANTVALQNAHRRILLGAYLGRSAALTTAAALQYRGEGLAEMADKLILWAAGRFPHHLPLQELRGAQLARRAENAPLLAKLATRLLGDAGLEPDPSRARELRRAGYLLEGLSRRAAGQRWEAYHMMLAAAEADPSAALDPLLQAGEDLIVLKDWGRFQELTKSIEGRLERGKLHEKAAFHYLVSRRHEENGDLSLARREQQKALRASPLHPGYMVRLAQLHGRLGDRPAANEVKRRLSLMNPEQAASLETWLDQHVPPQGP